MCQSVLRHTTENADAGISDADADADVWLKGLMILLPVWQDSGAF
jgi:hypothetical protein